MFDVARWARPGVRRREMWSWALYDFGNSGYTTVVLTAVFNVYYVSVVAAGEENATFLWTLFIGLSNFLSMLIMPMAGSLADARATKKRWLLGATLACVLGTVLLGWSGPGTWLFAGLMLVISNVGYNMGESLSSAFLPELARPESMGRASGWGWGLGYFGGLLALGIALVIVRSAPEAVPHAILWSTAALYAAAALPLFLFLKERSRPRETGAARLTLSGAARSSWAEILGTLRHIRDFKDFARLSLCGFFFQSGVSVVITLAAVYASEVMGFTVEDTLFMIFIVNITAAAGAFGFGHVQDRLGHKATLALTLALWIGMAVTAWFATSRPVFWVAANLAGIAMGACQSAGRTMVALLAPKSRLAEFFSFWNMALWTASVVGPVTYGSITAVTGGNHRLAILSTGCFFVVSLIVLAFIDMERGRHLAMAISGGDEGEGDAAGTSLTPEAAR